MILKSHRLKEIRVRRLRRNAEIEQPLIRLGDVEGWSVVKRADVRGAIPFLIARKEWDALPPLPAHP